MSLYCNQKVFLEIVKAGLWEQNVSLSPYVNIDLNKIYQLAQEQAVLGLVVAGIEHVSDVKLPQEEILLFVRETLQVEQRNTAMNFFISVIIEKLRNEEINALLLKGQGIAQCYERPLWRACGDVDLFLSESNYLAAKVYFEPLASHIEEENTYNKHLAMTIDSWTVELHGTLRGGLWKRVDRVLDEIQNDIIYGGAVRFWLDGQTPVSLPQANEDVIFVFTHILQHFFRGGIGLRQVCDWCRLLWTYKDIINHSLLEKRLKEMGLMSEWKTLSALAVSTLGMTKEAVPLYSSNTKWEKKAQRVLYSILEMGNFGYNRDTSYYEKYPYFFCKIISLWQNTKDTIRNFRIFPVDSIRIWGLMIKDGVSAVFKGR